MMAYLSGVQHPALDTVIILLCVTNFTSTKRIKCNLDRLKFFFLSFSCVLLCFVTQCWGTVTIPVFPHERVEGARTFDSESPAYSSPCLTQTTSGGQILILHLNYVVGYTLSFLFERTRNYYVDNLGLLHWQFRCMGRSEVRSDSLVK